MLVLRFTNPSSYLLIDYEYYGPTVVAGVTRVAHDRVNCLESSRQDAQLGSTWPWPRCNPQGFTQGGWLESESFLTPLVLGVTLGSSCLVYGYRVCMLDLGTILGASRQGARQWCYHWVFMSSVQLRKDDERLRKGSEMPRTLLQYQVVEPLWILSLGLISIGDKPPETL
ncbi:hypothetical protein BHM03_00004846 [Ensete ventricosum]|uniref:Uncharacterized protein n=1 Tax=Ensete ventricosum TaxID=4639 RepID=A0A445MB10_ENSVE|nr:hypothetical protein BHM03_00004846 [Ensete ventricosum]